MAKIMSDGDLNLVILNFKSDAVAGVERGKGWSGIHHIGFQEVKYNGPDGVMVDVSETGWVGTSGSNV